MCSVSRWLEPLQQPTHPLLEDRSQEGCHSHPGSLSICDFFFSGKLGNWHTYYEKNQLAIIPEHSSTSMVPDRVFSSTFSFSCAKVSERTIRTSSSPWTVLVRNLVGPWFFAQSHALSIIFLGSYYITNLPCDCDVDLFYEMIRRNWDAVFVHSSCFSRKFFVYQPPALFSLSVLLCRLVICTSICAKSPCSLNMRRNSCP